MIAFFSTFDFSVEHMLFLSRTPLGVRLFSLVTELGGGVFVIAVLLITCIVLWKQRLLPYAIGASISVAGAVATSEILKRLVERARPPLEWHAVVETSYSFPSNHSTAAAALYGFLAYLVWHLAPQKWRGVVVALLVIIVLMIGFSRMYLGVHYPTDVFGGFVIGTLFALVGTYAAERIRAHRSD